MALVRVLTKSFINNTIVEEGDVIEYDGKLGTNLVLVKDDKRKRGNAPEQVSEGQQEQAGE